MSLRAPQVWPLAGILGASLILAGEMAGIARHIEATQGQVDGKAAMVVVPEDSDDPVVFSQLRACMSPLGETEEVSEHPVGQWFVPPPGQYRVWIEGDWTMSPHSRVVGWKGGPFRGRGLVTELPRGGAGKVTLPPGFAVAPSLKLRLLFAGDSPRNLVGGGEITRQVATNRILGGVLMPAGTVVAAIWDADRKEYSALSRPFPVAAGKAIEVQFEPASPQRSSLVALLENYRAPEEGALKASLRRANKDVPAEILIKTGGTAYAIWYGMEPGSSELVVEIRDRPTQVFKVQLHQGKIDRVRLDVLGGTPLVLPKASIFQ